MKNKTAQVVIILLLSLVSFGFISTDNANDAAMASPNLISTEFSLPVVHFRVNTNCRIGPGLKYKYQAPAFADDTYEIVGKSNEHPEYVIIYEPSSGLDCWVWLEYATVFGDISELPNITAPPKSLASIKGYVWSENCNEINPNPSDCFVVKYERYAVGDGKYKYEAMLENIEIDLYEGTCDSRELISTAATNEKGIFNFQSLEAGTYCVVLDANSHGNLAKLSNGEFGGQFTFPIRNQEFQYMEFTMLAGVSYYGFNFGWDDFER